MKRLFNIVFWLYALLSLGVVVAQEAAPGFEDIINAPWDQAFVEVGALAAIIGLIVKLAGRYVPALKGGTRYLVAVGLGLVAGLVGDLAGILEASQYTSMPTPIGGLAFGLMSAFTAVGIHQGKRQTDKAFRDSATQRLRR